MPLGEAGRLEWNLLAEDVSLPAAVLYEDRIEHNLNWMQAFVQKYGVKFAPHGKTTMAPQLFRRQLDAGAWGITLATAHQTQAAYHGGVRRVLLANQLVGRQNMTIDRRLADFPVRAEHEHDVAGLRHAGAAQAFIGGDERHADAGRFVERQHGGLAAHQGRVEHEPLRVRAVAMHAEIAARAPHRRADPAVRAAAHDAGPVTPGRARPHRVRHAAERGLHVARVHAGRAHLDQHLAVGRYGRVDFPDPRVERLDVGGGGVEADAAHDDLRGGWLSRGPMGRGVQRVKRMPAV